MTTLPTPTFQDQVRQAFQIEPLGGPTSPQSYLDRFPEEVYDKTLDSHLVRFMYALLGPAGIGWLRKNYLEARLQIYAHGFETFDIERYYGDPLRFGRILSERFETDPVGLLPREEWDKIKAKDESYRSRATTYFNAARLGTTPEGMELAAQSGLGHAVEVVENYKFLFDSHSDEPLGLSYFGQTASPNEFVVIPRQEISRTEAQVISFEDADVITGGQYVLEFRGRFTTAIPWNATFLDVRDALRALSTIGQDSLTVTGGPIPNPFTVTFTGGLSNQNVPEITVISSLVDGAGQPKDVFITTQLAGLEATDEVVHIPDEAQHNMQVAIDYLRPVNSLPTTYDGRGTKTTVPFEAIHGSSQYIEVIRYVTGTSDIRWPETDALNWVEQGIENESRRIHGDLQYHYASFATPATARAYTDEALTTDPPQYEADVSVVTNYKSEHVGRFPRQIAAFPFLAAYTDTAHVFAGPDALHPISDPPFVTTQVGSDGSASPSVSPLVGGTIVTEPELLKDPRNRS